MRAHAITTKASTTVSGGILALGLAVVLLAATASTASAAFSRGAAPPDAATTLGQVPSSVGGPRGAELRLRRSAGRNDEPGGALYAAGRSTTMP